eukprot:3833783-Pleurochrysis_carterae.AAC.1
MATTGAGVLQLSTPGVLASVGCVGLAGSSEGSAVAASLVSRVPPARGVGGTEVLHMRVGQWHQRVAPTMHIRSKGECDNGTPCEVVRECGQSIIASRARDKHTQARGVWVYKDELARMRRAGAGRQSCVGWVLWQGGQRYHWRPRWAEDTTSAATVGIGADVNGVEVEASADAARA